MKLVTTINQDLINLSDQPQHKAVAADLISGDPSFRTWMQDLSFDGKIQTGIWEATPGKIHNLKIDTYEYIHILEGLAKVVDEEGAECIYKAGDSFLFKPGYRGTWETIETIRKIFVIVTR